MAKVKIQGNASGTGVITLTAPNTSTDRTVTLPDEDITLGGGVDGIVSTADGTAITINSGENVGIGDTDPSEAKLSITGVQAGDVGVKIDHDIVDTHALQIAADNTTARGIDVECNAVTTGNVAKFYSNASNTSTRNLVEIANDHVSATGTTALYVDNDSTGLAADFAGTGGIRSAGGIKFGTDTAAANTLDDYEEGTWTPSVLTGSGVSIGTVYANSYTRIGRVCTLYASFQVNASNNPSDYDVRFGGFPFSFIAGDNGGFPISMIYSYKATPTLHCTRSGYCYYQSSTVGGNNAAPLGGALQNGTNYMSFAFSYLTT